MQAYRVAAVAGVLAVLATGVAAQNRPDTVIVVDPLIVTATRSPRAVFRTPAAVSVVDSLTLQRLQPNTVTDVFRELPGLDVTGVGVQQPRPIIRGQRGQRILLLSDGIRLNNSRRQQDFGEVPALVDPLQVERVEIVRGPASVLYGTDAIGGVVNIITRRPQSGGWHGNVSYLFGAEEDQHRGAATVYGVMGAFDVQLHAMVRRAEDYSAPEGRFGNIRLDSVTPVNVTGIEDWSGALRLGWQLSDNHNVFVRGERYEAQNAGFGFIEPEAYAPSEPRIDIRYPDQQFTRVTLGWSAERLAFPLADRAELITYAQDNERSLTFNFFQGFGPQAPPGAGVRVETFNFSDLRTLGFRFEARKLVSDGVLLTWGADLFRDKSENTDSTFTAVVGFGPPQTESSNQPNVPNATYRSVGGFLQSEWNGGPATVILGARVQHVQAEAEEGQGVPAGLTSKGRGTVVGSANLLFDVTDNLTLIGTIGRGFRAPNLIEWFFDGPTPEGNGYQVRSPDLEPETSVNIDLGVRYRTRRLALEGFVFRNHVRNGIRIEPTGDTIQGFPAFRNVNLDKLRYQGIELNGTAALTSALSLTGTYTRLDSEDELNPENPLGDSFSSRVTGALRWSDPVGRFWAEYAVRHNGRRRDVLPGDNPLGDELPAFTTHALRGGVTLPRSGNLTPRLGIAIENLTDELYAEAGNASFFRPEPRRRVTLSAAVSF